MNALLHQTNPSRQSSGPLVRLLTLCAVACLSPLNLAAVIYYPAVDPSAETFEDAVASAGLVFLGRESFADVGVGQAGITPTGLLAPELPAEPLFPNGTLALLGLLFQTNEDGEDVAAPNLGDVLYATGPIITGERTYLGPNVASDSLDIFIDPPSFRGQTFGFAFTATTTPGSTLQVKVLDNNNTVISSMSFTDVVDQRIGIISSADPLFRINIFATDGFFDVAELDVYVVPEPAATVLLVSMALMGVVLIRRRWR
jgi:hypothetical protein